MPTPFKVGELVDLRLEELHWNKLCRHGLVGNIRVKLPGVVLVCIPVKLLPRPRVKLKVVKIILVN
jgi:hypothetical protein